MEKMRVIEVGYGDHRTRCWFRLNQEGRWEATDSINWITWGWEITPGWGDPQFADTGEPVYPEEEG